MNDIRFSDFQTAVDSTLARHRGVFDVLSKIQESSARLNRAVVKAATCCGCIRMSAQKQELSDETTLENLSQIMSSCVEGELCPNCRSVIEKEMGALLYYTAGLCNTLDLSMYDAILNEEKRLTTLGRFSLR